MNEKSWSCEVCTRAKATCFCCCEDQETFLCEECFSAHYKKVQFRVHIPIPINAFGQHKSPRYIEKLQIRAAKIPRAKAELLKRIDTIDQCITELLQQIENIISQLSDYGSKVISELREAKTTLQQEVDEGIAEVENTMYDNCPVLINKWARAMRDFTGDSTTLECFSYTISTKKVVESLDSICTFSRPGPAANQATVFAIWEKKLTIYYPKLARSQSFTLSQTFQNGTRLCSLEGSQLLAVGSNSNRAYQISTLSGEIVKTSEMSIPRFDPGVICVNNTAYVFGGMWSLSEKYEMSGSLWHKMENTVMYLLSPALCHFKDAIYLFGSGKTLTFSIAAETLQNENTYRGCLGMPLVWVEEGEIVIVSTISVSRWKPGGQKTVEQTWRTIGEVKPSQCPPVVCGRKVFFVAQTNACVKCLDLDTRIVTNV